MAFFIRQNSLVTLRQAPLATNSAAVETGALDVFIISTMASSFLNILDEFIVWQPGVPFFSSDRLNPATGKKFQAFALQELLVLRLAISGKAERKKRALCC